MECPPPCLMGNESEGDVWSVDITLMYAEHLPFLPPSPGSQQKEVAGGKKSLQELVKEQDKSKPSPVNHVTSRSMSHDYAV